MTLYELLTKIEDRLASPDLMSVPAVMIIDGIAHPIESVWIEPRQDGGKPALCIGSDPR